MVANVLEKDSNIENVSCLKRRRGSLKMFEIKTIDKIATIGLKKFDSTSYKISDEIEAPHGILVRSSKIPESSIPDSVMAIARAGIGINNIPVSYCTQKGIVVFNTPGANANGVKELVLLGMLLSARHVFDAISYVKSLDINSSHDDFNKLVEANKSKFRGVEIKEKTLGVVGLGSIGIMVANACVSLGMQVRGYDPFISVERAWSLSRNVLPAVSLNKMFSESDYLTLHVPLTDDTRGYLNKEKLSYLKKGCVVLNFSRGEIVNEDDILAELDAGHISNYVTDFPSEKLLKNNKVIAIPHLGASTMESEDNCATMVVDQMRDFLEDGNIKNSVNFPECSLERNSDYRLLVANNNVPNMLGQIATVLASEGLNIVNMVNKSKGNIAYNIFDISAPINQTVQDKIKNINGVIMQRVISKN